jgi:hypothetical protein
MQHSQNDERWISPASHYDPELDSFIKRQITIDENVITALISILIFIVEIPCQEVFQVCYRYSTPVEYLRIIGCPSLEPRLSRIWTTEFSLSQVKDLSPDEGIRDLAEVFPGIP